MGTEFVPWHEFLAMTIQPDIKYTTADLVELSDGRVNRGALTQWLRDHKVPSSGIRESRGRPAVYTGKVLAAHFPVRVPKDVLDEAADGLPDRLKTYMATFRKKNGIK